MSGLKFKYVIDTILYYGTGINIIFSYNGLEMYLQDFLIAKMLIRHHISYDVSCNSWIMKKKNCPMDIGNYLGPKLHDDIYYLISQGIFIFLFS
jgi:hypothetical protein